MARLCGACRGPVGLILSPHLNDRARSMKRLRWCNKFRGIIIHTQQYRYTLSGVSHAPHSELWYFVPYDRNDFYDYGEYGDYYSGTFNATRLLPVWPPVSLPASGLTCEYMIHADCWSIIERVIGPQAEARLDLIFQAMKDGWEKNSYDVDGLIDPSRSTGWLGRQVLNTTHQYRLTPVTEPTEIPALQKLVKRSMKKDMTSTEEAYENTTIQLASSIVSPSGPTTNIPVEIQAMILNLLPEWPDIDNALEVFSWDIPDFLWRDWFPHDLIFDELDGIPAYKIDWKVLYTGVMRLLDTSLAMMNRRRIVRVVKETREDFFKLLQNDSQPSEKA